VPGTLAVAFNCAVLSAVPHAIDAGLSQVIVGVGVGVGAGVGVGPGAGVGAGVGVVVGAGVGAGRAPGVDADTGAVVPVVDESAGVSAEPPPQAASTRLSEPITMLRANA